MSFMNAVMIPRPTLSDVPVAEESALGSTPKLEDDNTSTNVSINDNDIGEFSEGISGEHQPKRDIGTKRGISSQAEALHLERGRIKLMEESLMRGLQADKDEDCMFLMSLLPSIKKTG